ncbi:MAG: TnpV protein [Firmicutes bacterium]|nr:TnpV protein [Bacillota bacterium]
MTRNHCILKLYQQKKGRMNMSNLTYTQAGDYLVPDLGLPPQPEGELNRWGRARQNYLRNHKSALYMHMMTQLTLWPHLLEMQETAAVRFDLLTRQMAEAKGATEELKANDQMAWVGLVNAAKHSAEELVRQELIYS